MAAETSDLLPRRYYSSVQELRWNETATVQTPRGDVRVRALEVKHWGARVQRDTYRGYTGFVVEREGRRLLIGGDTALTPLFREHRRFGPFDAAVMPIGAYDPVDPQPLHAGAGGRDGRCRRGATVRAGASPVLSAEPRAVQRTNRARRARARGRSTAGWRFAPSAKAWCWRDDVMTASRRPLIVSPGPGDESVWDFPRPPRIDPVSQRVRVEFGGRLVADTTAALRVCETASPPTFYIPPADVALDCLEATARTSFCEWKGRARYWSLVVDGRRAEDAAWGYPSPSHGF